MKGMEVEVVSTQTIRPATSAGDPAPDKLHFTLSIFDQLMLPIYIPLLLFYSATGDDQISTSDRLKKSLSETLTHFFPLAGRIRDNIRVVHDEEAATAGIEYTEARVSCHLRDILSPPNMEAVEKLLPAVNYNSLCTERLLVVRQSVFECGGMAIGICFFHRVVDAAAIYSFLRTWSATARGTSSSSDMAAAAPYLSSASRFPPLDVHVLANSDSPAFLQRNEFPSRRFVLSGSQVASLKAKSCSQGVPHPTAVDAVVSLLWQCAMRSCKSKNPSSSSSSSSSSGAWQLVNLRNRIDPPLPDSTFGNLVGFYKASAQVKNKGDDLPYLVSKMRHAKEEYMRDYLKKIDQGPTAVYESYKQLLTDLSKENGNNYFFSSVCKIDLYERVILGGGNPFGLPST